MGSTRVKYESGCSKIPMQVGLGERKELGILKSGKKENWNLKSGEEESHSQKKRSLIGWD